MVNGGLKIQFGNKSNIRKIIQSFELNCNHRLFIYLVVNYKPKRCNTRSFILKKIFQYPIRKKFIFIILEKMLFKYYYFYKLKKKELELIIVGLHTIF